MENRPLPEVNDNNRPYWEAARKGQLLVPKCENCNKFFLPPRSWCPHCYSKDTTWEQASGDGELMSFSLMYITPFEGYVEKPPYVLAVVRLDEGPQMMCNIVDCAPEAVSVGARVHVVFEKRNDFSVPQFTLSQSD